MQDIKIDLVYLWVNDKDEEWQAKRCYWAKKLGIANAEENNDCRYSNNDELKYSLRSAEMYAPWINKIFIVTDNQIPNWLDTNHPKIKIIDHKEIMPEECLPCFNSEALETCIANIPELSEYFLCANDDKFFADSVSPNYFFDKNNNPIVNMRPQTWTKDEITRSLYKQSYLNTVNIFNKNYYSNPVHFEKLEPYHCIEAYRKSYYLECKEKFKKYFEQTTKQKFRAQNAIQRPIIDLYMIIEKHCQLKLNTSVLEQDCQLNVDNLYIAIGNLKNMQESIRAKNPKLLCINDGDYILDKDRYNLKFLLEELFSQKQKWEKNKSKKIVIEPLNNHSLPIVFAFNNEYSKYFSVTLTSIIENSSSDNIYDIVVLHTDIEEKNRIRLQKIVPSNFSLRFFNITEYYLDYFKDYNINSILNYWSKEIFYRIFIPLVMPRYKKVLYLDSDVIINQNIDDIFDIDFENKHILAVRDTISPVLNLDKNNERKKHIVNVLKLSTPKAYFNSGLILFNIPQIDITEYIKRLKNILTIKEFLFPDQDMLNKIFENNVKLISQSYNFCYGVLIWDKGYKNEISGGFKKDFLQALNNPKIIHYTSPKKPWDSVDEEMFNIFWQYARKTPYYEELMYKMCKTTVKNTLLEEMKYINLLAITQAEERVLFWGASLFLEDFIARYPMSNKNILGIIDKNICKHGKVIGTYKVYPPDAIKDLKPSKIIVTIVNSTDERVQEIKAYLKNRGYENIKVENI